MSRGKFEVEELPDEVVEKFVGGKGLAAYLAYREIKPGTDPLSPENKLYVFTGPLAYVYPTFSRIVVASKSPLTGIFCDSYAGGSFGIELRRAGLVGIVLEGKSGRTTCLIITREDTRLIDCSNLKYKTTYEVCEALRDYSVLTIGPAGENLVKFASIFVDMRKSPVNRPGVAGRGGLGAVMGSKNVKAIAIKGWLGLEDLAKGVDNEKRRELVSKYVEVLRRDVAPGMGIGGNLPSFKMAAEAKILPVKNFQLGVHENWRELSEEAWARVAIKRITCPTCPLACGVVVMEDGSLVERIEYETVAMNGSNLVITSREAIIGIAELLNAMGLDSITTGNLLGFLTELSERGVLRGHEITWGDVEAYKKLIRDIAYRRGIGGLLAEGVARVAEALGAEAYAVHVKKLEIPAYDPRGAAGMGLAYATADRGGDHLRAWTVARELETRLSLEELVELVKRLQDRNAALWTLITCDNIPSSSIGSPDEIIRLYVEMLNTLGFDFDVGGFYKLGERIYNLTRLFNNREGIKRKDDILPLRFYTPRADTGWVIDKEGFERMLDLYYAVRGWSIEGIPLPETLERLDLSEIM